VILVHTFGNGPSVTQSRAPYLGYPIPRNRPRSPRIHWAVSAFR
jgi:hypothetical protein